MQRIIITGGRQLKGEVNIHGAKNSVLPLISATVLLSGKSVLHNCPDLSDVTSALEIIKSLGITYERRGSDIEIFSKQPDCFRIPDKLMRSMRSSVMFLGAILGRCNRAVISLPGGCKLGPRPIDIHISALKKLGAKVVDNNGELEFSAEKLCGADVFLKFPSVGATENIIMASVLADGTTRIFNAAREPEIVDLADFLNKAGADIKGAGTRTVVISGVKKLDCSEHTVIPDRIEAATYMAAAAVTGGSIKLNNVIPSHLSAVTRAFLHCGCRIDFDGNRLLLSAPERLGSVNKIVTGVYPGFPTDAGPLIIGALSSSKGKSVLYERVFKSRFGFLKELAKFGADVKTFGSVAIIRGTDNLVGADCQCTDLRGGAALIITALRARGKTTIGNLCHINRGYEDIAGNLRLLGAEITEI